METCQFLFTKLLFGVIILQGISFFKNPTASIKSQGESDRNHFSKYLLTSIVNVNCSCEDGLLLRRLASPNILLTLNAKDGGEKVKSPTLETTDQWEFNIVNFIAYLFSLSL